MLMDEMIKDAEQDILHNRLCAALAYRIAVERQSPPAIQKLAVASDIVHNIAKETFHSIAFSPTPSPSRASTRPGGDVATYRFRSRQLSTQEETCGDPLFRRLFSSLDDPGCVKLQ